MIPLRLQPPKANKKSDVISNTLEKIFLRLLTIIIIRKATTPKIVSSQKTSCNLGELYIDNCELEKSF